MYLLFLLFVLVFKYLNRYKFSNLFDRLTDENGEYYVVSTDLKNLYVGKINKTKDIIHDLEILHTNPNFNQDVDLKTGDLINIDIEQKDKGLLFDNIIYTSDTLKFENTSLVYNNDAICDDKNKLVALTPKKLDQFIKETTGTSWSLSSDDKTLHPSFKLRCWNKKPTLEHIKTINFQEDHLDFYKRYISYNNYGY